MAVDLMPLYLAGLWCMVAKPDASASEPGNRWPLLLFLHGSGERGPPDGQSLHLVANHGPWKAPGLNKFMVVAPQCPSGLTWCGLAEKVAALTRALFRRRKQLDPRRCVLSGLSMGAFGCWSVVSAAPGLFGCVLAVCGGWAPALPRDTALSTVVARAKQKLTLREAREVSGAARRTKVWLFHGAKDTRVSPNGSRALYRALLGGKRRSPKFRLTVFPGMGHAVWARSFKTAGLLDWAATPVAAASMKRKRRA